MIDPQNPVLVKMLERLFASLVNGPAMNCRPHASRQRLDFAQFARLRGEAPGDLLHSVLADRRAKAAARVPAPAKSVNSKGEEDDADDADLSPEEAAAKKAWAEQRTVLSKLRVIADDARTYEQDTGVHVLDIGFPLLSLPPGSFGGRAGVATRRILAPVAFIPITLTVQSGAKQGIEIACRGEGVDLIRPNAALIAWLEQQTGQAVAELFTDDAGDDPWREIRDLVHAVAARVEVDVPELFKSETLPEAISIIATPRADDDESATKAILPAAVVGLFPATNQGLLRDTRDMIAAGTADGPIESFVRLTTIVDPGTTDAGEAVEERPETLAPLKRVFTDERLVTHADPCQTRAVRLARTSRGVVVHGPPGTGKSQTIANVIGDHLARDERVLFVCDKRTALDVVADRLAAIGFGDLLAVVHDPQRDQREFYRSVREQLDTLVDAPQSAGTEKKLTKIDAELQTLHDELSAYYATLMGRHGRPGSFHHLVGQWLSEAGETAHALDERPLQAITATEFDRHATRLRETLERGEAIAFASNPWRTPVGVDLPTFLARPNSDHAAALAAVLAAAEAADATIDPHAPPFTPADDLAAEANRRAALATALRDMPTVPVELVTRWATKSAADVAAARDALAGITGDVAALAAKPIDAELLARTDGPSAVAAIDAAGLRAYAAAVRTDAARFDAAVRAGGDGAEAVALKWMQSPDAKAAAARKKLDAAAPLAAAIEAGAPDAALSARWSAAPQDAATIVAWLAALNAYLDIAGKWTAIFHGARKAAATPAVAHFGLSLTAESATRVRQFLQDVQRRDDLRVAIETATGEPFAAPPDDADLLTTLNRHRAVLTALAAPAAAQSAAVPATAFAKVEPWHASRSPAVSLALTKFTLAVTAASAKRVAAFADAVRLRVRITGVVAAHTDGDATAWPLPADAALVTSHAAALAVIDRLTEAGIGTPLADAACRVMAGDTDRDAILNALAASPARARVIGEFEVIARKTPLISAPMAEVLSAVARGHDGVVAVVRPLIDRLDTVENVLRIHDGLANLPPALSAAGASLLTTQSTAAAGFSAVRRNVLAGEISRQLQANPQLQSIDGHRLQTSFDRFRELSDAKKEVVRRDTITRWTAKQKQRLLAVTGSRLNSLGADLRRRLTLRGDKAMRLRQVIAHGRSVDGGDPLFDLRPVWMASPETVAQLFAREPIFDVIVFDEASQCRLEEALPVLTRGKRIVIAGDPKQLPPTRFFESAVATSEDVDAETEQELFEAHQGDVEDLLTAALSVDGVEECYLNVHYRSRNSDLIGFSNEHFYGSRLQAIPGHPKNRVKYAPITLYRADGVYEKRRNVAEAEAVCKIVHDLLRRADPPSIGIACFNLVQRDLITETLEEWAEKDATFAGKLAAARERRGHGSSEGLFVKNLENVQGDERDHLIISTTYGPDKAGKFRRSFGPLGTAGGGRRLNVLVTRARNEIHLVTSIPRSAYASLPAVPSGSTPGGAWLLFAYLNFAERLKDEYEMLARITAADGDAVIAAGTSVRPSKTPSAFAKALGTTLADRAGLTSEVHWGNDGFCVDVAVVDPASADDVLLGVQCDLTRFDGSDDPVEWDSFQTAVHVAQGWTLQRVWTPHFFRDPDGVVKSVKEKATTTNRTNQHE